MSRRPKSRSGTNRSSQSRRRPAGPTPAQLAARLVEGVADDLLAEDPVAAEIAASWAAAEGLDAYWDAVEERGEDATPEPASPVLAPLRLLAQLRDARLHHPALALAVALRALAPGDEAVQAAAVDAERRLRFLGARPPAWAEAIVAPELLGCWCVRDVFSDSMTLYVGACHPGYDPHCVAARVEQGAFAELAGIVVTAGPDEVVEDVRRTIDGDPEAGLLRLEEWTPARMGVLLFDLLTGVEETGGETLDEESFELYALLVARVELLVDAVEAASAEERDVLTHPSALDAMRPTEVLARFTGSAEYAATDGTSPDVAQAIVAWVTDSLADGTARVSPTVVVELLGDLGQDPALREEHRAILIQHGIPTVRAWVRMCAGLTDLPAEALAIVEETLDEVAPDFEQLARTGAGPDVD